MTTDSNKILAGIGNADLAYFAAGDTAGPLAVAFTAEVQTVTIGGTPTGGTFTLTWNGLSSGPQTYNIATAVLQTALRTAWNASTLTVTGTAGTSYVITFPATRGNVTMIVPTHALTGGAPTIAVVETTPGAGSSPASAIIPAGFTSAGWITTAGLVANVQETANDVDAYGTTSTVRIIIAKSARTFDIDFLETNTTSISIYNRQNLGTVLPDTGGNFTQQIGPPNNPTYAGIFDIVDGLNHVRVYCPRLQVAAIKSRTVSAGNPISYGVTLKAIPDLTGTAVYEYYAVNALAS